MRRFVVTMAVALVLGVSGCGDVVDKGAEVADAIAEKGVSAYAVGRWRCETDEDDGGNRRHLTTDVAVGANGRFSYEVVGGFGGSGVGTWSIEDLRLRLLIPWHGDGRNGFYEWVHDADADPPTHLSGRRVGSDDGQEFDVGVDRDRVTLVQFDDSAMGGPNYDWNVTCTRESSDPGDIPATVPTSHPG